MKKTIIQLSIIILTISEFFHCRSKVEQKNLLALILTLNDQKISQENQNSNSNDNNFQIGAFIADTIVEAPEDNPNRNFKDPTKAINGVRGAGCCSGSLDVYSLGYNSNTTYCKPNEKCLVLEWNGKEICNGPGIDFVVFENGFCIGGSSYCGQRHFMEPIVVEISRDGIKWCGWNPQYIGDGSNTSLQNPNHWLRLAGIEPVLYNVDTWSYSEDDVFDKTKAGGDGFDVDDPYFGGSGDNCDESEKIAIKTQCF